MSTTEDQIKKLYSSQLASQQEQLKQGYLQADAEYAAEKDKAAKVAAKNIDLTKLEAQQAAVNNAELHAASGLTSGARAQARLARDNQLQADLTALRAQQQEVDADIERQRTLLSQQYQSAIREAQAENDYAKAQALYEEARRQQDALVAQQQVQNKYALEYAKFMAEAGNYAPIIKFYRDQGVNVTEDDIISIMDPNSDSYKNAVAAQVAANAQEKVNRYLPNIDSSNGTGLSGSEFRALIQGLNDRNEDEGDEDVLPNLNPYHIPEIQPSNGSGLTGSEFRALIQGVNGRAATATKPSTGANLVVDQSSVDNLGFGPITEETLMDLVKKGLVTQYIEDGTLKFRRSDRNGGSFYSTALMPNG